MRKEHNGLKQVYGPSVPTVDASKSRKDQTKMNMHNVSLGRSDRSRLASSLNTTTAIISSDDPALIALETAQEAHRAFMERPEHPDPAQDDKLGSKACDAQADAFWAMVQTAPTSFAGALAVARFMLGLEEEQVAPDVRPSDGSNQNIAALALKKLLSFYGETAGDPSFAAVEGFWSAREAFSNLPDTAHGSEEIPLKAAYDAARKALLEVVPTSAESAGAIAEALCWWPGELQQNEAVQALHNISAAFGPQRLEMAAPDDSTRFVKPTH